MWQGLFWAKAATLVILACYTVHGALLFFHFACLDYLSCIFFWDGCSFVPNKNIPIFRLLCTSIKQIAAPSCHVRTQNNILGTGFLTDLLTFEGRTFHSICYTADNKEQFWRPLSMFRQNWKLYWNLGGLKSRMPISTLHMSKRTWQGTRSLYAVI